MSRIGRMPIAVPSGVEVSVAGQVVTVKGPKGSLTINIVGVGYRVAEKGKDLEFQLGYSHSILFPAPEGISYKVESPTKLHITGIDKQLVGEVAAKIKNSRSLPFSATR